MFEFLGKLFKALFRSADVIETAMGQVQMKQHEMLKAQRANSELTKDDIKENKEFLDML